MSDFFVILIDRLKGGRSQKIEGAFDPAFLQVDEPDLRFATQVHVQGEAYLTDAHLIIHLKAHTAASMPCAVCNQMIAAILKLDNFYHTAPVEEIRGAKFDFTEALREAFLIELPKTIECNGGNCPERATMTPYLRPSVPTKKTTYFPFADVDKLT